MDENAETAEEREQMSMAIIIIVGMLLWTAVAFGVGMDMAEKRDEKQMDLAWQHGYNQGWDDCKKKIKEKRESEEV